MSGASEDRRVEVRIDSELSVLVMFLDYLRESVARKVEDIDEERARQPLVPSGTNLLGLIQHLTMAERRWFGEVFAGSADPLPTRSMEVDPDVAMAQVVDRYRAACAASNAAVMAADDDATRLAVGPAWGGEPVDLRWILLHMIEETARHAGHADILREQLDGRIGR